MSNTNAQKMLELLSTTFSERRSSFLQDTDVKNSLFSAGIAFAETVESLNAVENIYLSLINSLPEEVLNDMWQAVEDDEDTVFDIVSDITNEITETLLLKLLIEKISDVECRMDEIEEKFNDNTN